MISELFLVLSPITAQKRNEGSSFEIQSFLIDLHFSAPLNDGNKPILCNILLRPYFEWRQKHLDLMGPLKRDIHVA